jgi:hypothetical protein
MKRTTITLAALLAAMVPAAVVLWGNASFSQAVPVRVPASAQVVTPTSPATTADDHGGDTPRDQRTEPGDDRDGPSGSSTSGSGSSGSGSSGSSGSGSSGSGSSGSGHSGSDDSGSGSSGSGRSGSDDSGSDDHGGGGHGSDD